MVKCGFCRSEKIVIIIILCAKIWHDSKRSEDWILYAHNQTQSRDAHSRTKHGTLDKWNVKSGHKD